VTAKVAEKDVPVDLAAIGNVEAYALISVRSQVTGQLNEIGFQEGDSVKTGQQLFMLDRRPFEAGVAEIENGAAGSQGREALPEGDVEGTTATSDANEEGIDDPGGFLASGLVTLAREWPVEEGGGGGEGSEAGVGSGVVESAGHEKNVAGPSDIRRRAAPQWRSASTASTHRNGLNRAIVTSHTVVDCAWLTWK
jgi:pyruvate/2-oxoglutarate dehydrogenase complex dihydrolipoamide acyltransferase (E2) component